MPRAYRFIVGPKEAGLRLDRHLVRRLPTTYSRRIIQRAIEGGAITIEGRIVKAHRRLKVGEAILARLEEPPSPPRSVNHAPEPIPLSVVYEDAQLLVVDKPAGLVTHPAPGHWSGTLLNAILWHLRSDVRHQTSDVRLPRAGIVHRLDKDTSGLLLIAKTPLALAALTKQMKARTVSRKYLALVKGHVPLDQGMVNAAIGRHLVHRKEMAIRHLGGRAAVTHYRVLTRYGASSSKLQASGQSLSPATCSLQPATFAYTLVEVSLETGRTHQVRVHLAYLGYPVLGDPVYSRMPPSAWRALGIRRQLLHAYRLAFRHPSRGHLVELTGAIPDDMKRWCGETRLETANQKGGGH